MAGFTFGQLLRRSPPSRMIRARTLRRLITIPTSQFARLDRGWLPLAGLILEPSVDPPAFPILRDIAPAQPAMSSVDEAVTSVWVSEFAIGDRVSAR